MPDVITERVKSPLESEWLGMVFPSYRPLLASVGVVDADGNRPFARCVTANGRPIGLALGAIARDGLSSEILSVYVVPDARNIGVATELIKGLEADIANAGATELNGTYMTTNPTIPALERVLAKAGFSEPVRRSIAVRFLPEEPSRCVWYRKARMPEGATIFPWTELTAAEREWLPRSQAERAWIHPDLEVWRFDEGFDPVSSFGMRLGGDVVGWVVNHVIAPELVRFTVAFMRRDLALRGASFPLYVESLKKLQGTGVTCTFITASQFPAMNRFILRRVCPFVSYCGETRGVAKTLGAARVQSAT